MMNMNILLDFILNSIILIMSIIHLKVKNITYKFTLNSYILNMKINKTWF